MSQTFEQWLKQNRLNEGSVNSNPALKQHYQTLYEKSLNKPVVQPTPVNNTPVTQPSTGVVNTPTNTNTGDFNNWLNSVGISNQQNPQMLSNLQTIYDTNPTATRTDIPLASMYNSVSQQAGYDALKQKQLEDAAAKNGITVEQQIKQDQQIKDIVQQAIAKIQSGDTKGGLTDYADGFKSVTNNSTGKNNDMIDINQIYANLANSDAYKQYLEGLNATTSPSSAIPAEQKINGQSVDAYNASKVNNPTMPDGTLYNPVNQQMQANEKITGVGSNLQPTGQQVQSTDVNQPQQFDPAQMEAFISTLPVDVQAQIGQLSEQSKVQAQTGTESEEFKQAIADVNNTLNNAKLSQEASVKYQYEQLMDFDAGETPAWAAGAMRTAMQSMAARGIDASTMAGEAITSAVMQAALPIAQQDAQIFASWDLAVLDKKSQVGILRASHLASLDLANLNNRQQAAVVNAQSFLQMDMTNLNNRQQAAIVSSQQRLQKMLSDQSEINAARQFNATSQNQVNQFFTSLSAEIEKFNSAQQQSADQFNSSMQDSREKFNAENALLIEQSNVQYLRQINTANTAEQNKANFTNSQNLLEISNTAMANLLTLFRDRNAFIFEESENSKERAMRRTLMEMDQNIRLQLANKEIKYQTGSAIGGLVSDLASTLLDKAFE